MGSEQGNLLIQHLYLIKKAKQASQAPEKAFSGFFFSLWLLKAAGKEKVFTITCMDSVGRKDRIS